MSIFFTSLKFTVFYIRKFKTQHNDSIIMLSTETFLSQGEEYLNRGGFIDVLNIGHSPIFIEFFLSLLQILRQGSFLNIVVSVSFCSFLHRPFSSLFSLCTGLQNHHSFPQVSWLHWHEFSKLESNPIPSFI